MSVLIRIRLSKWVREFTKIAKYKFSTKFMHSSISVTLRKCNMYVHTQVSFTPSKTIRYLVRNPLITYAWNLWSNINIQKYQGIKGDLKKLRDVSNCKWEYCKDVNIGIWWFPMYVLGKICKVSVISNKISQDHFLLSLTDWV